MVICLVSSPRQLCLNVGCLCLRVTQFFLTSRNTNATKLLRRVARLPVGVTLRGRPGHNNKELCCFGQPLTDCCLALLFITIPKSFVAERTRSMP